ncbi:MAG: hypothetical protein DRR42_23230 [Gammaproteobacteria bacterium]|nr:MAG: hypothetical protein DRR42_23230 [Gammaproteobacteria bacterium]
MFRCAVGVLSATQFGLGIITEIMGQLRTQMPLAIDAVGDELPLGFPEQLRDLITRGILNRLSRGDKG